MNHFYILALLLIHPILSQNWNNVFLNEYDYDNDYNRNIIDANQSISDNIDYIIKEISVDKKENLLLDLPSIYSNIRKDGDIILEIINNILSKNLNERIIVDYLLKLGETLERKNFNSKDKIMFYEFLLKYLLNKSKIDNSSRSGVVAENFELDLTTKSSTNPTTLSESTSKITSNSTDDDDTDKDVTEKLNKLSIIGLNSKRFFSVNCLESFIA